ncbi:MAG: nucleotidyl transferase AbiEii/AbiGii toxin family protein [Legionella sp.]|nr:nucleotidyl transferase AbiEii/AbiGii toxin family protein [Legionella sp.]
MIPKQELLQMATNTNLSAQVIEKDYLLGWLLAGIGQHAVLGKSWVFKGGTCLKKCYFETYRFSEDLDFTLQQEAHLDIEFLKNTFSEIADWIYEMTGIEFPVEKMRFDSYKDGTCQGRIYYRGPIAPTSPRQMPKIKLDLTAAEIVVEPPVLNFVKHPYSDRPAEGMQVQCYSYVEVFAEKTRALAERTRPRDLYDVINFYRRPESKGLSTQVKRVLEKKCSFKGIKVPQYHDLLGHKNACLAGWNIQLAHQVRALPSFESFWDELPNFFNWLEG